MTGPRQCPRTCRGLSPTFPPRKSPIKISRCGRRSKRTSPRGSRLGVPEGPGGISSARPWPGISSATTWTSTREVCDPPTPLPSHVPTLTSSLASPPSGLLPHSSCLTPPLPPSLSLSPSLTPSQRSPPIHLLPHRLPRTTSVAPSPSHLLHLLCLSPPLPPPPPPNCSLTPLPCPSEDAPQTCSLTSSASCPPPLICPPSPAPSHRLPLSSSAHPLLHTPCHHLLFIENGDQEQHQQPKQGQSEGATGVHR